MTNELLEKMNKLNHLIHRWHRSRHMDSPFGGRSDGQGRVLRLLKLQQDMPTRDLSYLLDIRQQSLNELLNKLEKRGFVERRPSEEDKRVMIVHLTDSGKEAAVEAPNADELFEGFTEEETAQFLSYIERLSNVLEEKTKDFREEEPRPHRHHMEGRRHPVPMPFPGSPEPFPFIDDRSHDPHGRHPHPEGMPEHHPFRKRPFHDDEC